VSPGRRGIPTIENDDFNVRLPFAEMVKFVVAVCTKKELETRAVEAAQSAGFPLPAGQLIPDERPDFRIVGDFWRLGLEVSHVVPPPRNESFKSARAEEAFYQRVVRGAEALYRRKLGVPAVKVTAGFWYFTWDNTTEGRMIRELAQFALDHRPADSTDIRTYVLRDRLPDGFSVLSIAPGPGTWLCNSDVTLTLSGIHGVVESRISEKNKRIAAYRRNVPGAPIWLLLYSDMSIAGGIVIPHEMEKRPMRFDFDRVFLFAPLSNGVVEISRTVSSAVV
jgi:hypothetical protein